MVKVPLRGMKEKRCTPLRGGELKLQDPFSAAEYEASGEDSDRRLPTQVMVDEWRLTIRVLLALFTKASSAELAI